MYFSEQGQPGWFRSQPDQNSAVLSGDCNTSTVAYPALKSRRSFCISRRVGERLPRERDMFAAQSVTCDNDNEDLRYKQFRAPSPDVSWSGSDSRAAGGRSFKPEMLVFFFRGRVFVMDETSQPKVSLGGFPSR